MNYGNYNNYNSYNSNGWSGFNTNFQYVTSLEEALSRCNIRNTETVCFHQDLPIFYRIRVEQDGRKYWQQFNYDQPKEIDNRPVVRQDLVILEDRIKNLERMLRGDISNEQSNGQISIPTTESSTN